jgi:hypothetical protein
MSRKKYHFEKYFLRAANNVRRTSKKINPTRCAALGKR